MILNDDKKYGFVYIWFDKKRKMYYIGSHWGTEDDRYICSSNWMKKAYKKRPNDFRRKIIKRIYTTRYDTLEEENKYLKMIKNEELKIRYYNLSNKHFSHWSTNDKNILILKEKISLKTKEAMQRPDVRQKYENGLKRRDTKSSNLEVREKRRKSMIGKNKGKDNSKAIKAAAEKNTGSHWTYERKVKMGKPFMINDVQYISLTDANEKLNIPKGTIFDRLKSNKFTNYNYI